MTRPFAFPSATSEIRPTLAAKFPIMSARFLASKPKSFEKKLIDRRTRRFARFEETFPRIDSFATSLVREFLGKSILWNHGD